MERERLVTRYSNMETHYDFGDCLACWMANIEDGLLTAGAEPEEDYDIMDLYEKAFPMAKEMFFDEETEMTFVTSTKPQTKD